MGVQGLWSLLGPAARPTQLESLRQKRIAVDASIWIHQFMRTMRDKEGNALRNGHLLGFFRRICKLLFYDIKPVFVFDGGAPTLKRSTIRERRKRREGVKVNLRATAKKILSAQVKSRVLLEEERMQRGVHPDENFVYAEELEKTAQALRKTRKTDEFELPAVDAKAVYTKLDPRLATIEELKNFVDEFKGTDLDIDSESFQSLAPEVQYEVLQDVKNKSRQTSWARLDEMVRRSKTAMDFSKHQIKMLKYRNTVMQRVIQLNRMSDGTRESKPTRIAGERGRQYVLYKNENLDEGLGWRLPGLSAEEPVIIDQSNDQLEPDIEEPVKNESPPPEEEDKVKAAMASNPKLAALFSGFLSDEDDNEDNQEEEEVRKEEPAEIHDPDQPLFENTFYIDESDHEEPEIMNDMRNYMSDDQEEEEAIQQVISRIYDQDEGDSRNQSPVDGQDDVTMLSANDLLSLWLSRMPDAFLYLHSFNDEHKRILSRSIHEHSKEELQNELKSVAKQFGKTNERDELALESLTFHREFLENILLWKDKHTREDTEDFVESSPKNDMKLRSIGHDMQEDVVNDNENIVVSDDEDDQDIQFVSVNKKNEENNETIVMSDNEDEQEIQFISAAPTSDTRKEPVENLRSVNINFQQSSLTVESSKPSQSLATSNTAVNDEPTTVSNEKTTLNDENTTLYDENTTLNDVNTTLNDENITLNDESMTLNDENTNVVDTKRNTDDEKTVNEEHDSTEKAVKELEAQIVQESAADVIDRGYNSEDEQVENTHGEEDEYARFVSDIASKQLDEVRDELYKDMKELNKQQRKEMGNSDDVTDQMVQDIQELLKLFGIPYLVSPMEAEAQCAELETLQLIDGTITDDSDVFLFGASRVYKNMFNQQRFVECYVSNDIEREMLLSRKTLIQLAYLLGSDYTDGIPGVGPVAAMEILSEFMPIKSDDAEEEEMDDTLEGPLIRFKEWYNNGIDTTAFQRKFRKSHPDIDIADDFPNPLVKEAYFHPAVDDSKQKFEWGQPQLDSLRIFLTEAFGWSEEKADQVLLPVLREMNSKKTNGEQKIIDSFFNVSGSVSSSTNNSKQDTHKHSSKRVRSIVERWRNQKKAKNS